MAVSGEIAPLYIINTMSDFVECIPFCLKTRFLANFISGMDQCIFGCLIYHETSQKHFNSKLIPAFGTKVVKNATVCTARKSHFKL